MKKKILFFLLLVIVTTSEVFSQQQPGGTTPLPLPSIGVNVGTSDNPKELAVTLQLLILLTVLSVAPSILLMTTSYLRIIITLHFLRNALGTMTMPPNQLLAGIALFVTFFIMAPTWNKVANEAFTPMMNNEISMDSAYAKGIEPIREFMFKNAREQEIEFFVSLSQESRPANRDDLPTHVLIPAFVLSELRASFIIGFFIFVPFLVLDMVISSILMAMGMMMLPPAMISMPFKILLFILVDGWTLTLGSLIKSFNL